MAAPCVALGDERARKRRPRVVTLGRNGVEDPAFRPVGLMRTFGTRHNGRGQVLALEKVDAGLEITICGAHAKHCRELENAPPRGIGREHCFFGFY